jgi:uncharacterized protein with HEPN domain
VSDKNLRVADYLGLEIVWKTIEGNLPALKDQIEAIVRKMA